MITYNNKQYPTRLLDMGDPYDDVLVAQVQLQNALEDPEYGEIRGALETAINDSIFFYVDKVEWELPDDVLIEYIKTVL